MLSCTYKYTCMHTWSQTVSSLEKVSGGVNFRSPSTKLYVQIDEQGNVPNLWWYLLKYTYILAI